MHTLLKTYTYRENTILKCAVISRVFIILLQAVNNNFLPDHDAKVFLYPKLNLTTTIYDEAVEVFFGGLVRWDAHYFMHIARYGYTYENTTAFFPLYPMLVKLITNFLSGVVTILNIDSLTILVFVMVNMYVFAIAALTLYRLSCKILPENLAYKSALLFSFNPASIFFVAPYSETIFSYLSFTAMYYSHMIYEHYKSTQKSNWKYFGICVVSIALSICTRSNGLLNIGFLLYYYSRYHVPKIMSVEKPKFKTIYVIKYLNILSFCIMACITPFVIVQNYFFNLFCQDFDHQLPKFIVTYGKENNFVLPGTNSKHQQSWCASYLPISYSYVQDHYWNVGFLRYYTIKQIPNFLLATPIVYLILSNAIKFYFEHENFCQNLGIFSYEFCKKQTKKVIPKTFHQNMFVYAAHATLLTIFCVLFIHVQVTTRMLCSASPIVYWFAAHYFNDEKVDKFLFAKKLNREQTMIKYYFLGYLVVGTMLFCNFLPWT